MAYLNASCPLVYCQVRREFLHDLKLHHGELEDCVIIGVNSIKNRALGFTILTRRGAQFTRVPLHAFVHRADAPKIPLGSLELWDCFAYHFTVTQFQFLKGKPCRALLRDYGWEPGDYVFTVDWCAGEDQSDLGDSEDPEHKSAHIIALENGCFAALPNNRIVWLDPSYVDNPHDFEKEGKPTYITHSREWSVERDWHVAQTDEYYYGTE